jgi:hypothetical protein
MSWILGGELFGLFRFLNHIFAGNNETPLKYTGGMVLAVPVDADLFNLTDEMVRSRNIPSQIRKALSVIFTLTVSNHCLVAL